MSSIEYPVPSKNEFILCVWVFLALFVTAGCKSTPTEMISGSETQLDISRLGSIPAEADKLTPETDNYAPRLHANEWFEPVPLPGPINTAGAEDSPFISPDGSMLYFFFTPDVTVPVEKQLLDGVTGIYLSRKVDDTWSAPERVVLQEAGKLALDGCGFFDGETLWFCSAREGYTGLHWFSADLLGDEWGSARLSDFFPEYEVGELHIHDDELFFHSIRSGGQGQMDLWVSNKVNDEWQSPVNLTEVNTEVAEGYPFLTVDGQELWFTRWHEGTPAIFRSIRSGNNWSEPELIISQFAGEPTLDPQGNIYFVHHFYKQGKMIEADIYVAIRK